MMTDSTITVRIVPGKRDLEEMQAELLHPLARLVAAAIRQGLAEGKFKVIGNKIEICGTMEAGDKQGEA